MKAFDLDRTPWHTRERNRRYFARPFRALVVSERECLALPIAMLLDAIAVITASLASCVVHFWSHSPGLRTLWKRAEKISWMVFIERVQYLDCKASDKGKKEQSQLNNLV